MSGSSHPPEGLEPSLIQKGKVRDVSDFFVVVVVKVFTLALTNISF